MKKDAAITVGAIAAVLALCYGLAVAKLDLPPIHRPAAAAVAPNERVVMRVNGEPVTETEFQAAFQQLPEDVQRQLQSAQGKDAFAEQMVKIKLLEQEARRLGLERDPRIAGVLAADRASILASAAAQKLATPSEQAVQDYYNKNKGSFEAVDVSHILIAYQGGMAPPRQGQTAPPEPVAQARGQQIVKQLRAGGNFATLAAQYSDDAASGQRGGVLGTFSRGMMPPEIEGRVFALKEGQISDAFPSRFGIHIMKAGKRTVQPIEQARPMILRKMQEQNTLARIDLLRRIAKVDFDPKYFPDAKRPPVPPAAR